MTASPVKVLIGTALLAGLVVFGLSSVSVEQVKNTGSGGGPGNNSYTALVGKPAPDFELSAYDGQVYSLKELRGKKIVLFFNEGLMCYPGCWNQIAAFGTDPQFNSDEVLAFSITADPRSGWAQAISKMPSLASAKVLFDTDRTVSQKYGVLSLPSSMHKGSLPGHTYLVIDREGIVRYSFDDPKMGIRNQEILAEVNKLN